MHTSPLRGGMSGASPGFPSTCLQSELCCRKYGQRTLYLLSNLGKLLHPVQLIAYRVNRVLEVPLRPCFSRTLTAQL